MTTPTQRAREVFDRYAGVDSPVKPSDALSSNGNEHWLSDLQVCLARWQVRNFGGATGEQIALGVCEEAGEIAHAVLKASQRIRGMADPDAVREAVGDGIADCAVYLMQLATLYRLDFGALVEGVAVEVMKRDWTAAPADGVAK